MMSKFFRSSTSSHSSSSTSSSEEDDDEVQGKELAQVEVTDAQESSHGSDISLESITLNRRSSASGSDQHRDFLLHALLEEKCTNEVIQERGGSGLRRSSREDREIQLEAQLRYQRLCAQLAPLNLVSMGLDHERHKSARQRYRDGLRMLRNGRINATTRQNRMPALPKKLLTNGNANTEVPYRSDVSGFVQSNGPPSVLDLLAPSHQLLMQSQYLRDFEELGVLGRGGYGTVFHVKHRLDGLTYAVKKVAVRPSVVARIHSVDGQAAMDDMLAELRTLAKLEHPNVVRYFNSWIEWSDQNGSFSSSNEAFSGDSFTADGDTFKSTSDQYNRSMALDRIVTQTDTQEEIGVTFESLSLETTNRSRSITGTSAPDQQVDEASMSSPQPTLALHMQMALYPLTLQDFITPKATSNVTPLAHCFHLEPSIAILLAIIDGIEYLHSENIVHRDLKPANIFLRIENNPRLSSGCVDLFQCSTCRAEKRANPVTLNVCIGDFGLVTEISQLEEGSVASKPAVGTEIYRPKGGKSCISPKLDIFALGIIAFELLWKFDTQMERRELLQSLKDGVFPTQFSGCGGGRGKVLQSCIEAMLSEDPWDSTASYNELRGRLSSILKNRETVKI